MLPMMALTDLTFIPPVTRGVIVGSVGLALLTRLELVPVSSVLWPAGHLSLLVKQPWRFVTAALFYPPRFQFLMLLYFFYTYSSRLEKVEFANRRPSYAHCLTVCWLSNLILSSIFSPWPFFFEHVLASVVYVWSKQNRSVPVSFMFGIQVSGIYLPWLLALFNWFAYGSIAPYVIGIVSGHIFYFFTSIYPTSFVRASTTTAQTPPPARVMQKWLDSNVKTSTTTTTTTTRNSSNFRPFTGTGRRLDEN